MIKYITLRGGRRSNGLDKCTKTYLVEEFEERMGEMIHLHSKGALPTKLQGYPHHTRTSFFVVKGPAVDATNAPQPSGLLCNPVIKMIRFFVSTCNGAPVE
jgi:hypothetical protein